MIRFVKHLGELDLKFKLSEISSLVSEKIDIEGNVTIHNYISTDNMLTEKKGVTIAEKLPSVKKVSTFQKGDILISNIRPYFKKIWFAEFEGGCSADVLVFRPNEKVSAEFLYCLLSSDDFFDYMTVTAKGTKMPRGDKEAIKEYEVEVPSMEEQKIIAGFVFTINRKIIVASKINDNLDKLVSEIISQTLSDEVEKIPLFDYVDGLNGHAFYKDGYDEVNDGKQYFVFDLGNIDINGRFILTNKDKFFNQERLTSTLSKFILEYHDLVMIMTDRTQNMAILGKTTFITKNDYFLLNQRIYRLRVKNKIFLPFIWAYLNSNETHDYFKSVSLGTSQKYINVGQISNLEVPNISIEKATEIYQTLYPIMKKIESIQNEALNLEEIKTELLPRLLTGQIELSR
ncbi:type I restriction enzyme, S subunit [Enterococcus durans]|uniref:Type I restriction enzyme, S subunit n=1 Tax=Enterococcus durans TaxID=53345 RepID=A0A377KQ02_9ENTE|nr:type I restriction enzyme, S subunit [Enterococcus durans]